MDSADQGTTMEIRSRLFILQTLVRHQRKLVVLQTSTLTIDSFVDYKDLVLRFIIVTNTKFYTVGSCASPARNNFTELLQPLERVNTCC